MKKRPSLLKMLISGLMGLCGTPVAGFETVVLDAGHGGRDEGTRWYHISEEDLTLAVAKKLGALLEARGISVVQTRLEDRYVSLDERAAVANRHKNSLLVSIHFNASRSYLASGFQTYHFFASPSSRIIAESIQQALAEKTSGRSRGVMKNDFAVLTRTNDCAVLVECGFISNKREAKYFATEEGQDTLAEALAAGILRVKPVVNNDPPECLAAKVAIQEKKAAAAARKLALSGVKPSEEGAPSLANTCIAASVPVVQHEPLAFLGTLRDMLAMYEDHLASE